MFLKGLSLGLKMVAAYHVLMLNLWWNPSNEDQVVDRAHRIGQTQPVTVSILTIKDTAEDHILLLKVNLKLSAVRALDFVWLLSSSLDRISLLLGIAISIKREKNLM
jgi:hypothetical protein